MVPPLPAAPRTHPTWRNNESYNVLEGHALHNLVNNKGMQIKIVITIPWQALCVDLIGPYTLKGKDGTIIDFMALTMINPATSWFEVVELPLIHWLKTVTDDGKESSIIEEIFDNTSEHIAWSVNKTWLNRYPRYCYIIYNNGSEFKLNFEYLCITHGIKSNPTMVKNPQANAILQCLHQVLAQMLRTAELDNSKTVTPNELMSSLTTRHGPFALPIIQSLKHLQAWQYLYVTCSSTFCS